jgi:HIRAN domain
MSDSTLERIPVVAGLGYIEHVRRLPSAFTAQLQTEPDNRYFRHAIAVIVNGEKVGYVAPEIAQHYYEGIRAFARPVTCPGRPARHSDHETSGVELLLDFRPLAGLENHGSTFLTSS